MGMVRGLRIRNGVLEAAKNNDAAMDIDLTLEGDCWEAIRDDEGKSSEFQLMMITSALQRIRRLNKIILEHDGIMCRLTAIASSSKNWHYSQGNQMRIAIWIVQTENICRSVVAAGATPRVLVCSPCT